jgi:hypothetical protein
MTGSLRTAVSTPSLPPEGQGRLDAEEAHAAEMMRRKAVLIASSWVECDQVIDSEVQKSRIGPSIVHLVLIRCGNGTRFYLDPDNPHSNPINSLRPARRLFPL